MSAAQRDMASLEDLPFESATALPAEAPAPHTPADLRQQAADRIAAHRARRSKLAAAQSAPVSAKLGPIPVEAPRRSNAIAAAVAERYAQSPSYRTFLAEEAEKATRQAAAAAEVANRNARAIAEAQQTLMQELELWSSPARPTPKPAPARPAAPARAQQSAQPQQPNQTHPQQPAAPQHRAPAAPPAPTSQPLFTDTPVREVASAGITVRLYEDLGPPPARVPANLATNHVPGAFHDPDEHQALDEEIAFRQSPVFEEHSPLVSIPANLLEFPRQLVAARKARPVLALGPLLETSTGQLRIFEVEPQQLSPEPAPSAEWSSLWLDTPAPAPVYDHSYDSGYGQTYGHAYPQGYADHNAASHTYTETHQYTETHGYTEDGQPHAHTFTDTYTVAVEALRPAAIPVKAQTQAPAPQAAAVSRRLMASAVDALLTCGGFVIFASVFIVSAGSLPFGLPLAVAALAALAGLGFVYQLLFFTFAESTPGMRYARIGLCTFTDENPTRAAMRRRLLTKLLATLPLGLGLLWAFVDDEHMGWHDRLSRIYQREY